MIDLVSDTATRPTPAMKKAMIEALLGDEQKGEDPTTNALEARVAQLAGFERALFLPSATMANQIALALHAGAGDEIIAHKTAHVVHYEGGGTTVNSRAQLFTLDTPRGIFSASDVENAVRADDPHHPRSACVVVENTSNGGGGTVWPLDVYDGVAALCAHKKLALHIDGARLWHAAVALNVPLSRLTRGATTVQLCFSKGLGCPFGAVLLLPSSLWPRARRLKQSMGGALRQSGVITGAMSYALDHHLPLLKEDHRRAARFADGIGALAGVSVEPTETNLVFFSTNAAHGAPPVRQVLELCAARGVRFAGVAKTVSPERERIRACFHLDVSDKDVDAAVAVVKSVVGG